MTAFLIFQAALGCCASVYSFKYILGSLKTLFHVFRLPLYKLNTRALRRFVVAVAQIALGWLVALVALAGGARLRVAFWRGRFRCGWIPVARFASLCPRAAAK